MSVLKKLNLNYNNLRAAMLDRAATNKLCIEKVDNKTKASITRAFCNSHSMNKPG